MMAVKRCMCELISASKDARILKQSAHA